MKLFAATVLLSGSSLFALAPAMAQTTEISASDTHAASLDEIIVTAQRRSGRLQDVPITVSALTSEALEAAQVRSVIELQNQTPALVMNRYGNATVAFIRGVGSVNGTPGQEAAVTIYVDGIYHAAPFTSGMDFNNIERVEVLKGPQGTLFGRNATGGAIQIITREPKSEPEVTASVAFGSFRTVDTRLYATTGITDKVAADIAVTYHDQIEGFGKNLTTGSDIYRDKNFSARSKWVLTPSDAAKITVTGQYYRMNNSLDARKPVPGATFLDGSTYESTGGYWDVRNGLNAAFRAKGSEFSGRLDYSFGGVDLVSLTGYQKSKSFSAFDQDGTPVSIVDVFIEGTFRTFTQEVQLLSPADSKIKWIVGGFFMSDRSGFGGDRGLTLFGSAFPPTGAVGIKNVINTRSYSVFGEATVPLGESTRITAGARWSRDKRKITGQTDLLDLPTNTSVLTIPLAPQSATFTKPTWRFILDHHFTSDIMAYASVSRGFKSGNYDVVAGADPAFLPEVLTSYEVGIKSELFDRRLRLNLAGYYYRYDDMQLVVTVGPTQRTNNAGKSELAGVDFDGQLVIGGGLNLNFGAAYAYSKFLKFENAICYTPSPAGGSVQSTCDQTGQRLPKSPKLSFTLTPSYEIETEAGKFAANVSWYHTSSYRWETAGRVIQPAYDLVNARLGWTTPDEHLGFAIFGKNLLQEKFALYAFGQGLGNGLVAGPKRTYGAEVSFKF